LEQSSRNLEIYYRYELLLAIIFTALSYFGFLILTILDIAGLANIFKYKINYDTVNHVNDYDETVNANVLNEHANAANRFFHTQVAGHLK